LHIVERICDKTGSVSPPDKPLDLAEFTARAKHYCAASGPQDDGVARRPPAGPLARLWDAVNEAWPRSMK
jgi:hypothetical protein